MATLISRRSFFSLLAAPAIVHASNIMPVKMIPFDPYMLVTGTDVLTGNFVERKIYEDAKRADAFLSIDFFDKYRDATQLLSNVSNAVVESRDQEKEMRFIAPSHLGAYSKQGSVTKKFVPARGVASYKDHKGALVGSEDFLFHLTQEQLKEIGYYSFA